MEAVMWNRGKYCILATLKGTVLYTSVHIGCFLNLTLDTWEDAKKSPTLTVILAYPCRHQGHLVLRGGKACDFLLLVL